MSSNNEFTSYSSSQKPHYSRWGTETKIEVGMHETEGVQIRKVSKNFFQRHFEWFFNFIGRPQTEKIYSLSTEIFDPQNTNIKNAVKIQLTFACEKIDPDDSRKEVIGKVLLCLGNYYRNDAGTKLTRGEKSAASTQYERAEKIYLKVLEFKKDPDIWFALSDIAFHANKEDKQLEYLKNAADLGHSDALIRLAGKFLDKGEVLTAVDYYKKAAELNPEDSNAKVAKMQLAKIYARGRAGVPKDKEKAANYYLSFLKTSDNSELIQIADRLLQNPTSQDYYILASHQKLDDEFKTIFLQKASDLGHGPELAEACYKHAKDLLDNPTDQIDYRTAAQFFEKAAKEGHTEAKLELGLLYDVGLGVETNEEKGCLLVCEALGINSKDSQELYKYASSDDTSKGVSMVLLKKAATLGHIEAKFALSQKFFGSFLKNKYLKEAADGGHAQAQYLLGCNYFLGTSDMPKNKEFAEDYLKKAASNGYGDAQYFLAILYEDASKKQEAVKAYEDFLKQKKETKFDVLGIIRRAKLNLALLYAQGENGVEKNLTMAKELLKEVEKNPPKFPDFAMKVETLKDLIGRDDKGV